MTNLELTRIEFGPQGTFGVLTVDKRVECFTLELPWKNNEKNISCIPTGQYFFSQYMSGKYERLCLAIHDVYGRTYICVHPGNTLRDTTGCILPGQSLGVLSGARSVLGSNTSLDALLVKSDKSGLLTVRNSY